MTQFSRKRILVTDASATAINASWVLVQFLEG